MIIVKYVPGWNAAHPSHITERLQKIIEKIMRDFDAADCFYGLFQAMMPLKLSPFVASHDYCLKVSNCKFAESDLAGQIEMNISPIYHLGLEYPEDFKKQNGKALDKEAVIGLLEKPAVGTHPPGLTAYSYGVDAGIVFQNSKMSHNKTLQLEFENIAPDGLGIVATLTCEQQTTSKTFSWEDVGITNALSQPIHS